MFIASVLVALFAPALALHVYFEGSSSEQKCFLLDLGRDALLAESHSAWELESTTQEWVRDNNLQIEVTIDEVFDRDERVYQNKHNSFGELQFMAHDGGEHRICYRALTSGWWSKNKVKLELDFDVGTGALLGNPNADQVGTLGDRIPELNRKLVAIRREQQLMREREAAFRDQSERTNGRVTRLTLLQLVVLVATCAWQVTHLRTFFTKQKLI